MHHHLIGQRFVLTRNLGIEHSEFKDGQIGGTAAKSVALRPNQWHGGQIWARRPNLWHGGQVCGTAVTHSPLNRTEVCLNEELGRNRAY